MKKPLHILSLIACTSLVFLSSAVNTNAQTATINFISITPADCEGGGSVQASVSVPGACSVDGFLPGTTCALFGPGSGQNGASFTTYDSYQVGRSDLPPGNYFYRVTALSPCSGVAEFPFTIEDEGTYPDIEITNNAIDCSNDDFVTVQNNSPATVTMAVLDGPSLGTIAPGQSADYPNSSYNFILTASTSSCPTPIEFVAVGPFEPGTFGLVGVSANVSANNASGGLSNGSASVNITNGQGPFTIEWSTGESTTGTSSSIMDLAPGTYTVEITSGNGCTLMEEIVIANEGGTNVENLSFLLDNVKIVPNPSRGSHVDLFINALQSEQLTVSIINSVGQEVVPSKLYSIVQGSNQLSIDLNSSLATGLYYVKIIAESKAATFPMIYAQD